MKKFSDMGIVITHNAFIGEQIKPDRILNHEIIIHDFKLEDSKHVPGTKYLNLQIEFKGEKRVVFVSGVSLIEAINKIEPTDFPFITTLVKSSGRYEFS